MPHLVPYEDVAAVAARHHVLVLRAAECDALHRLRVSVPCDAQTPFQRMDFAVVIYLRMGVCSGGEREVTQSATISFLLHFASTCVALQHFIWQLLVRRLVCLLPLVYLLICSVYQHIACRRTTSSENNTTLHQAVLPGRMTLALTSDVLIAPDSGCIVLKPPRSYHQRSRGPRRPAAAAAAAAAGRRCAGGGAAGAAAGGAPRPRGWASYLRLVCRRINSRNPISS